MVSRLEIDFRSGEPIYTQIVNQIQQMVAEGDLQQGDQLPTVRQLATDLEINPNTVARAYGLLEREGIIETARRRGTRISGSAPRRAQQSLIDRIEATADRVIRETAHLGIDPEDLVTALEKRLGLTASRRKSS